MAVALSWEDSSGLPPEITEIFGNPVELLLAIPEHKVMLPGGRRASQCDVFALIRTINETIAVAIEAKVNEPFGPTIGDWIKDASEGKLERLRFICDLLGVSGFPPDELRYQLFHRTASAIVEANRFKTDSAAMIVQSFSTDRRWYEDFKVFAEYLRPHSNSCKAFTCVLPTGMPLILGWALGSNKYL